MLPIFSLLTRPHPPYVPQYWTHSHYYRLRPVQSKKRLAYNALILAHLEPPNAKSNHHTSAFLFLLVGMDSPSAARVIRYEVLEWESIPLDRKTASLLITSLPMSSLISSMLIVHQAL